MPHYNPQDDAFSSNSHFLSPAAAAGGSSRKSQSLNARKSTASLRGHVIDMDEDDVAGGGGGGGRHHSLAHELAVALMPEPSAGSKLLAEEFGIEYDEGAEGIDEVPISSGRNLSEFAPSDADVPSLASEFGTSASDASFHDLPSEVDEPPATHILQQEHQQDPEFDDPVFASPSVSRRRSAQQKVPELDAMEVLAQDLESTDKFLNHLRTIDTDPSSSSALGAGSSSGTGKSQHQQTLERLASAVISRLADSLQERETQVRELLECEREFRKIAGEVGGNEVLGQLDELEQIEDLTDAPITTSKSTHERTHSYSKTGSRHLDPVVEDEPRRPIQPQRQSSRHLDWERDPDRHHLGDEEEEEASEPPTSPMKESFPPPPSLIGPPTPASAVPQLAHLRTSTASLVSSLTTISEHAQVNGAATTEAGRKIRALKNKLTGWRTEWDSAERSRLRIERWEAGIVEGEPDVPMNPTSPGRAAAKRIDGRRVVEEHLRAFEKALADAALKTQAIMAR